MQATQTAHGAAIIVNEQNRQFHLTNGRISYIIKADEQGTLLSLYFGKAVPDREDFGYLIELAHRPTSTCRIDGDLHYSLEHLRQEYPEYGTGDYRTPAIAVRQPNGSDMVDLTYDGYHVSQGKPKLEGLPATYVDNEDDAATLSIDLVDRLIGLSVTLNYTVFADKPAVARSVVIGNNGADALSVERAMSLSLDLPDSDYDMTEFTGAWSRERHPHTQHLHYGTQQIESLRNASGHFANPVAAFARPGASEDHGEVIGLAFEYSGNFDLHAEVDTYDVTRLQLGINERGFAWHLEPGETFQTPEALIAYSDEGYDGMSRTFHRLVLDNIVRGAWKRRERPILINNWEATYFDFDEDKLVDIARTAKQAGVELFVLDDGWFGARNNDTAGLGDWTPNPARLPQGLAGLSKRINDLGLKFGLWFEPEMVNKDSDLYRAHPDWAVHTPGRRMNHGRNEFLLNFANKDVVDNIYGQMSRLLDEANIAYIKWDMNRFVSEGYDVTRGAEHQGEAYHRYILGVYDLLERLLQRFPDLIIEGCASGGGRFDMGMLYYTPQIWCSDDTDAIERLKIQYGTSYFYPLSAMGAHVSVVPNHQANRITPIETRANVAMFGTFGYELDLNTLSEEEFGKVRSQIEFFKRYREIIHTGDFHRLVSPDGNEQAAWMVVSRDRKTAIVGDYRILLTPNSRYMRLHLRGLDENTQYRVSCTGASSIDGAAFTGAELMRIGMVSSDGSYGEMGDSEPLGKASDFSSRLFVLTAE